MSKQPKKEPDQLAAMLRDFVAVYARDKPTMLDVLTVTAPLLSALHTRIDISDEAMLALSNEARSLALTSMALAFIAKANPELASHYQRLFAFLGYDK